MNKSKLIRIIRNALELDDFKPIGVGAGVMSLRRKRKDTKEEIVFQYLKFPGIYILKPVVTGWKSFNNIESILEGYYLKNNINYRDVTIHFKSRREEEMLKFKIRTEEDVIELLPLLKDMVKDVLSFFDEYSNLIEVHKRITQLETKELANFVRNAPHPRIMVIKRIVGAEDWASYCEEVIDIYRRQSEGKHGAVFSPIYKFLPALYEELKNYNPPN